MQAFHVLSLKALPDNHFSTATADVHDKATAGVILSQRMGNAQINQARLFTTTDHRNRMPQRLFSLIKKAPRFTGLTQRIGTDCGNISGRKLTDAFAETAQAIKSTLPNLFGEVFIVIQPGAQAH